jgi:hypothetical protein
MIPQALLPPPHEGEGVSLPDSSIFEVDSLKSNPDSAGSDLDARGYQMDSADFEREPTGSNLDSRKSQMDSAAYKMEAAGFKVAQKVFPGNLKIKKDFPRSRVEQNNGLFFKVANCDHKPWIFSLAIIISYDILQLCPPKERHFRAKAYLAEYQERGVG